VLFSALLITLSVLCIYTCAL